jgi:glycosyltransferase involved in cell wall biosynthesis
MSLVTCIMPTADRRHFLPSSIRMFLAQDYADKELLIVDDGNDGVRDLVPCHPQIRYVRRGAVQSLGSKRNFACGAARGDIILHWDDDDWYAPWRVRYQVESLRSGNFQICGLDRAIFVSATGEHAWEYVYPRRLSAWIFGATLCYWKSFWEQNSFADVTVGEDSRFVRAARDTRIGFLENNHFFVARIHTGNTCPKRPAGGRWQARSIESVRSVVGSQWEDFLGVALRF